MNRLRLIPRLDIKGPNLVKPICFEGLRVIGNPAEFANKYYFDGADELLFIDIVASLYQRNQFLNIISTVAQKVFIPIIVCGGVRSVDDMVLLLRNGADKIAINTGFIRNPSLITEGAELFGRQCMIASIEAKKKGAQKWECYVDNGREKTGLDAVEWAKRAEKLGAGEILVTSVDNDGMRNGFEIELIKLICETVSIPVIGSGGAGNTQHFIKLANECDLGAVCCGSILHYNLSSIPEIKEELVKSNFDIRTNLL